MCGICGFTGSKLADREKVLEEMMGTLIHRGPDEGKSWCSEHVALGFRRLAIIDLEGGSQPMVNETGKLVLVFNGEIYNYKELRSALEEAGHVFWSQGDSEVLLHGYEEWGEDLTAHLRGMFAFAIWDEERQELFAARDFFGIKPFYYTVAEGQFVFASEIKSILAYPRYQKRLNEEALEQYLSFQYSPLEETFFKGIYRLLPGHRLIFRIREKKPRIRRYFRPELLPEGEIAPARKRELADGLEAAIQESVQAHMVADVEVGTFLSGGVDSGLIAAMFTGSKAFTVGFGENASKYNEIPLARKLAREKGLEYQEKHITAQEFWNAVPEVMYYLDEPSADPSAVALYYVAREASRQVKVVVSGEGADELFGGYRIYCEPEALRPYQRLPLSWRKSMAAWAGKLPDRKGRNFLIRGSKRLEERFIGNAQLFSQKERKALLKTQSKAVSPQELLREDYETVQGLDEASRMQYIDLLHWLPGDILQKADRMSMAHSLELRVPYLDREVFETARRLPADCKQKGQRTKVLFRRVASRHLSGQESRRKKLGFPVPLGEFFASEEGEKELRKVFFSDTAKRFFREEELRRLLEEGGAGGFGPGTGEHRAEKSGRGRSNIAARKVWAVYAFLVWADIYFAEEKETIVQV